MNTKERNRREMPNTAAKLDEMMAVFGKPAYFAFNENGRTVAWGTQSECFKKSAPSNLTPCTAGAKTGAK